MSTALAAGGAFASEESGATEGVDGALGMADESGAAAAGWVAFAAGGVVCDESDGAAGSVDWVSDAVGSEGAAGGGEDASAAGAAGGAGVAAGATCSCAASGAATMDTITPVAASRRRPAPPRRRHPGTFSEYMVMFREPALVTTRFPDIN